MADARAVGAALTLLLAACTTPSTPVQPQIAITIDDLPVLGPYPSGLGPKEVNAQMISALRAARVPGVYGMVNAHWIDDPRFADTAEVLRDWAQVGAVLGSHGWAHRHLSEMTVAEFEEELVKNEPILRKLGNGKDWRWFRYPFLDEGKDAEQRAAARRVLAKHGYKVAAVTMDTWDWQWTAPYARCSAAGDLAAIAELERMYLDSAKENISVARETARKLHGRDIPYVQLMHISAMSARMMPRLLQLYRDEGFRFVSLADAQRDPVYAAYNDPTLPAPARPWEQARAKGIELPQGTDRDPKLAAMCTGGPAAFTP